MQAKTSILTEDGRKEIIQDHKDVANAVKDTVAIVEGIIEKRDFIKNYESSTQNMTVDEKNILDNYIQSFRAESNNNIETVVQVYPILVGIGEATAGAGAACARTPACASAVLNLFGIVLTSEVINSGEEKKETHPKGVPSTSGHSATGMPPNGDDKKQDDIGKQSKKMNDKQIAELVGNPRWHQTNLKSKIINAYRKELKGSKNFDFYKDPKSGNVYIKGNQSKEMIRINLEKFL